MALTKRTDIESNELKGVVLAVDQTKIKPGIFIKLQNWIPSGIGSILKKRGVAVLNSNSTVITTPVEDCTQGAGTVAPSAPTVLTAVADDIFQIELNWTDNSADEAYFSIERCDGPGCTNFLEIDTVAANITTYTDSDLLPDTQYTYRVRAVNSAGVSAYTNEDSDTTPAVPVEPPLGNLILWLDASQEAFSDGDLIDQFNDQSGEANNFTGSLTTRPIFKTESPYSINSLPVILFDGIDDFLQNSSLDSSGFASASIFIVGRLNADPPFVDPTRIGIWNFNAGNSSIEFPGTDGVIKDQTFSTARKTTNNTLGVLSQPFQYNVISQAGSWKSRLNRNTFYSTVTNTFQGRNGQNTLGLNFDGVIAEVLIFDAALTDSSRNLVESYLRIKWDLP